MVFFAAGLVAKIGSPIQSNPMLKFIIESVAIYINLMFTVYLIKGFGVETLAVWLAFIKCCGVAINVAGLPNV